MTSSCVSGRLPLGFAQVLPLWVCWHNFSSMLHVCTLLFSPAHTPDFCFHRIPCLSLSSSNHFAHPFGGLHAYLCCHFPISFCSSSVLNQPGVTVSTMERWPSDWGPLNHISVSEIRADNPRCGLSTGDSNLQFHCPWWEAKMQNQFKETKFEWAFCSPYSMQSCGLRTKLFAEYFSPFEVTVQRSVWVDGMYLFFLCSKVKNHWPSPKFPFHQQSSYFATLKIFFCSKQATVIMIHEWTLTIELNNSRWELNLPSHIRSLSLSISADTQMRRH